ncbi:MAG: GtrA family protein [Caulobacteraceae bacterium]
MTVLAAGLASRPAVRKLIGLWAEFWRYFLVSLLALGVDFSGLIVLTRVFHVYYLVAAPITYMTGAVLQYVLSIVFVFHAHRMRNRAAEFVAFALLGLLGLGATQLVLWLSVGIFGLTLIAGKVAATGVSFVTNYAARRALLFSERGSASG